MRTIVKRSLTALGAAVMVLGLAEGAEACTLMLQPSQDQWIIRYDPFAADAASRQFDVAVVNVGDEVCSGRLRVDLKGDAFGLRGAAGEAPMAYALVDERNGADLTPRTGVSARRPGVQMVRLAPGERGLLRFTFAPQPGETPGQGVYGQDAVLVIEDERGVSLGERPIALAFEVIPAAVMGLKGQFQRTSGAARIDLGELTPGARDLSTSLFVMSTGGYSVSVRSANNGRLRLGATEWYVDYAIGVGDRRLDLASPERFEVVSNRARADDYPLSIEVGAVTGRRAGDYTDVLTFTVAAL